MNRFQRGIPKVPKNTPYCYSYNEKGEYYRCPFHTYRKCGKRSGKNPISHGYWTHISKLGKNYYYEYCKFLKRKLSIGDQCKDCGVGDKLGEA